MFSTRSTRSPRTRPIIASLLAVSTLTATAGATLVTAPAHAAGSSVTIRPESLSRGAEVHGAHLASPTSKTIIDGDVKVPVQGTYVDLLGKSGTSYVVRVMRAQGESVRRIGPKGSERVVADQAGVAGGVLASDSGLLAVTRWRTATSTKINMVKVSTGEIVLSHTFPGYKNVLDVRGSRAILASEVGTYSWNLSTDRTTLLTRRAGSSADLRAGLLATYDKDPYDGGCSIITSIAQPQKTLWKSCRERVDAFSPDGQRIATVDIMADGLGPNRVTTRSIRGYQLASYKIDGYFEMVRWESNKVLLLDSYGRHKSATVRCTGSTCVRATALGASPNVARSTPTSAAS
jgi:hypothetical protein